MKDPWRVIDPIKEQRIVASDPDRPARINGPGDKDMDADWRPHRSCFLRFKSCSFEMCGPDLQTPRDALEKLARCIRELWQTGHRQHLQEIGIVAATRSFVTEKLDVSVMPAARLACEDVVISFVMRTLDEGTLVLARFLIEMTRKPATAAVLKKHGVTPMLRTT